MATAKNLNPGPFGFHKLDARELLTIFPKGEADKYSKTVDITITSPPYHNLKNYKFANQIGYGQTWKKYLEDMRGVFEKIYKVTRTSGSLWLVADTFRKKGRFVELPHELSKEAQAAGWTLRDTIIWEKGHTLPWSSKGQLRKSFEYVLFFSKSRRFKYHIDRIRQLELGEWWVKFPERYNPRGKAPSGIWEFDIPVQGKWRHGSLSHVCPFPTNLVHRILLLCSDENDVVLDPFAGSGVVLAVAEAMNRQYIGLDLSDDYISKYNHGVKDEIAREMQDTLRVQEETERLKKQFERMIIELRQLKHARLLLKRFAADHPEQYEKIVSLFLIPDSQQRSAHPISIRNKIYVLTDGQSKDSSYIPSLEAIAEEPELSTFGIESRFRDIQRSTIVRSAWAKKPLYLYKNGTTWAYSNSFSCTDLSVPPNENPWNGVRNGGKPIISPIRLNVPLQEVIKMARNKGARGRNDVLLLADLIQLGTHRDSSPVSAHAQERKTLAESVEDRSR